MPHSYLRKAAINKVIAAGGIYYDADLTASTGLTAEAQKIMTYNAEGKYIEIDEDVFGYGIGFVYDGSSKIYIGTDTAVDVTAIPLPED